MQETLFTAEEFKVISEMAAQPLAHKWQQEQEERQRLEIEKEQSTEQKLQARFLWNKEKGQSDEKQQTETKKPAKKPAGKPSAKKPARSLPCRNEIAELAELHKWRQQRFEIEEEQSAKQAKLEISAEDIAFHLF